MLQLICFDRCGVTKLGADDKKWVSRSNKCIAKFLTHFRKGSDLILPHSQAGVAGIAGVRNEELGRRRERRFIVCHRNWLTKRGETQKASFLGSQIFGHSGQLGSSTVSEPCDGRQTPFPEMGGAVESGGFLTEP
jgi:hypothetical protein